MLRPAMVLGIAAILVLTAPPAAAQEEELFSEFHFNKLEFKFWPAGVENRQSSDGKGSAITVHVDQVKVEGLSASELRHCIDHDMSFCAYDVPHEATTDGTVTAAEVDSFEKIVTIVIKSKMERVKKFAEMLQENVTVDGMKGKTAVITRVDFQGAEGKIESEDTVIAFVDAKVTYENDPKAKSHTIKVDNLPLRSELFVYDSAVWTSANGKWGFDVGATTPEAAKSRVSSTGYFSNQDTFESLADQGLQIHVKEGAGKKSPGLDAAFLLAGIALLAVVLRRRL